MRGQKGVETGVNVLMSPRHPSKKSDSFKGMDCVSRAQRSAKRSEVVRCRPGTVTVCGGPGSAVHRGACARSARSADEAALHRIRDATSS
jgi:hypothetical protein